MNRMNPPFLGAQFPSLIQPWQLVPSLASNVVSGISMSSCARVEEMRWLMLAFAVEFAFVERSAAAVPCYGQPHRPDAYLFAHPRDVRVVYSILGHNVEDAAVLVGRRPERALAQRHVVKEIGGLSSGLIVRTHTDIIVPSFAPVGRGSPSMAPFSYRALSSDEAVTYSHFHPHDSDGGFVTTSR